MILMRHAIAALLLLAACQTGDTETIAQPVIGAELDTGDPAVAALVFSNNNVFCTGTLISPNVVLTAAHCIDDASGDPNIAAFFTNDTEADGGRKVGVTLTQQHPMWNGNLSGGHDVGLLLLAATQDPELAVPVNTEDLAGYIGAEYRVVGFGIHDMGGGTLDGKKRTGMMSIARLVGDYLEAEDPETIICQGDSGGPGFLTIGDAEVLAGVHSYSISGCANPSGDARPDLWWDSFISPWIEDHDISCGLDGLCARVGCVDDPDCQPCGADGTCTTECPLPDVDCPTQAVGEICQADTQCETGLCVYWQDDPHSKFCSEACGGDGDCPDGMRCQQVSPFGRVCYYAGVEPPGALGQSCEEPTDCSEYVCAENRCTYACDLGNGQLCPAGYECDSHDGGDNYYCWGLPTDGGCSAGGQPALLWVLALIPLARAARSRRGSRR